MVTPARCTTSAAAPRAHRPVARRRTPGTGGSYLPWKRAADVVVALVAAVACAPIVACLVFAIELESSGPGLFTQRRVGRHGRPFRILKLRTMRDRAEEGTGPVWASARDARVTRLGRVLRATHLDELPQLFNVIAGDMSLVGPRPERPVFVGAFRSEIPGYDVRHTVRPGMTGLAQVHQGNDRCVADVHRKLAFDLEYIRDIGWRSDLRILCATVPVVMCLRSDAAAGPLRKLTPPEVADEPSVRAA